MKWKSVKLVLKFRFKMHVLFGELGTKNQPAGLIRKSKIANIQTIKQIIKQAILSKKRKGKIEKLKGKERGEKGRKEGTRAAAPDQGSKQLKEKSKNENKMR